MRVPSANSRCSDNAHPAAIVRPAKDLRVHKKTAGHPPCQIFLASFCRPGTVVPAGCWLTSLNSDQRCLRGLLLMRDYANCRTGSRGFFALAAIFPPASVLDCPVLPNQRGAMRLSEYFLPLLRENPSEAQIVSHRLMLRAGMIRQSSAGIYSWLPLGLRVLRKVERIVREEQDRAGAQEILMPTVQPAELWRESGRYEDYGKEMLRIRDRHDREMLYGPTN